MKNYNIINIDSAKNLVATLRAIQEDIPDKNVQLIYRGVGSDEYSLLPSAFRIDGDEKLNQLSRVSGQHGKDEDIVGDVTHGMREFKAIGSFYSLANQQGLTLPTDSSVLHSELISDVIGSDNLSSVNRFYGLIGQWPQPELLPMIALAQHYGIPTRMLDWSDDPLVAAYFAARSAIQKVTIDNGDDGNFAIWFANKTVLGSTTLFDMSKEIETPRYSIRVVDVPFSGNPNLRAQKGRFTIVFGNEQPKPSDLVDRTTVDQAMVEIFNDLDGVQQRSLVFPDPERSQFTKIAVPRSQAQNLLTHLRVIGYHAGTLFPGFQGCADSLFEAT